MIDLEKVKLFAKKQLQDERTGHDFYHGQRVAHLAEKMYLIDNPQAPKTSRIVAIIKTGSYLHDTIDEKICDRPELVIKDIKHLLEESGFESLEIADILFTIQNMSFSANIEQRHQLPLSGQYVQDADRLESLGAIGIARAFTYGGKHGNLIYDPKIKPVTLLNHDQYRNHEETTINHFYEKLFNLEKLMNTKSGKKEAHRRTEYMRVFIAEFMNEWEV